MGRNWLVGGPFLPGSTSTALALGDWDKPGAKHVSLDDARRRLDVASNPLTAAPLAAQLGYVYFDLHHKLAEPTLKLAHHYAENVAGQIGLSLRNRTRVSLTRFYEFNGNAPLARGVAPEERAGLTQAERALALKAQACAFSAAGWRYDTLKAIGKADERWANRDPEIDPPWLCGDGDAEHYGDTGESIARLALLGGHPTLADTALERLRRAVYDPAAHLRTKLFSATTAASVAWTCLHDTDLTVEFAEEAFNVASEHVIHTAQGKAKLAALRRRVVDYDEVLTQQVNAAMRRVA